MRRKHRYRAPGIVYTISILAFLLAISIAVLYARGYSIDAKELTIKKTGLVVIRSVPRNAFITIDNKVHKEQTPARLKLAADDYFVKVDKPGLRPFEKNLTIAAQTASFEENILLFRIQPEVTKLGESVTASVLSVSGKRVAFIQAVPEGAAVRVSDVDGTNASTLATLDARYRAPTSLNWSSDSAAVLVAIAPETSTIAGSGEKTVTPLGGSMFFVPGSRDTLLRAVPGKLTTVGVGTAVELPLLDQVTAFSVSTSTVLISTNDKGLTKIDFPSGNRRLISSDTQFTDVAATTSGRMYAREPSGDLYQIEPDASPERIAEDVLQYRPASNGSFVSIVAGQEIRLYDAEKRQSTLVTRLAAGIDEAVSLPDGHYIAYRQAGSIHVIAKDGTNDQILTAAGTAPLTFIGSEAVLVSNPDGSLQHLQFLDR